MYLHVDVDPVSGFITAVDTSRNSWNIVSGIRFPCDEEIVFLELRMFFIEGLQNVLGYCTGYSDREYISKMCI